MSKIRKETQSQRINIENHSYWSQIRMQILDRSAYNELILKNYSFYRIIEKELKDKLDKEQSPLIFKNRKLRSTILEDDIIQIGLENIAESIILPGKVEIHNFYEALGVLYSIEDISLLNIMFKKDLDLNKSISQQKLNFFDNLNHNVSQNWTTVTQLIEEYCDSYEKTKQLIEKSNDTFRFYNKLLNTDLFLQEAF
ncbi:biliverdin-producing heme oxygenase [Sediminitomix flava]|uniref:Heme oxygenase n=1 Tax=Sediminitomix flava TaxID=379075 RepID=A0A315ZDQ1_SEDFL|nr:biliverdin-producing heme oxygenase [Sediminitomix flava]PWJ43661.1 heme oxygenase [Sediminitomix flava]